MKCFEEVLGKAKALHKISSDFKYVRLPKIEKTTNHLPNCRSAFSAAEKTFFGRGNGAENNYLRKVIETMIWKVSWNKILETFLKEI